MHIIQSDIPPVWITGTPDNKLAEIVRKSSKHEDTGLSTYYFVTKRTFTACKPVEITKHKNPLSYLLELRDRFTIKFRGNEPSGNFTVKQKTIAEIVAELKNGNALCDYGIDVAISMQIKGFEKTGLLGLNSEIEYKGFFLDESRTKIIPSKVNTTADIDSQQLRDALEFVNKVQVKGYQNRLDLFAHINLFGMISPCSFIFKLLDTRRLEWTHLHGSPNATKTKSARYVLCFDGHQNDKEYNVNLAHIDTTARFGDTISKSTFPVLVNEVDFTDDPRLRNNVKSAVDDLIFRKVLDTSRRAEQVPALSAFFLTGNPPPPYSDTALMKRLIDRYHSESETHSRTEQAAKEFDDLFLAEEHKLQVLGLFRNKFIMEHQELILDKTQSPFDKSRTIFKAAYQLAEMEPPEWLTTNKQIEQNQLENSIADNKVMIKCAFETYIDVNFRNALTYWQREAPNEKGLDLPTAIVDRLVRLVDSNLLADVKRRRNNNDIVIHKGILAELHKHGVTPEQLPNLTALHHCIKGSRYQKYGGYWVIAADCQQLSAYFDLDGSEGGDDKNVI